MNNHVSTVPLSKSLPNGNVMFLIIGHETDWNVHIQLPYKNELILDGFFSISLAENHITTLVNTNLALFERFIDVFNYVDSLLEYAYVQRNYDVAGCYEELKDMYSFNPWYTAKTFNPEGIANEIGRIHRLGTHTANQLLNQLNNGIIK